MLNVEKVACLRDKLVATIGASYSRLLSMYPLDCYIQYLDSCPAIGPYMPSSRNVTEFCCSISREASPTALESYHKLLLVALILRARSQLETSNLPQDIKSLYEDNFERIVRDIELDRSARILLLPNLRQGVGDMRLEADSGRWAEGTSPRAPPTLLHQEEA